MSHDLPSEPGLGPELRALLEQEGGDPYADMSVGRKTAHAKRFEYAAVALGVSGPSRVDTLADSAGMGRLARMGAGTLLVAAGAVVGAWIESTSHRQPLTQMVSVAHSTETEARFGPPVESSSAQEVIPSVDVDSLPRVLSATPRTLVPAPPTPPATSVASRPPVTSLTEEQRHLDIARAAIARGAYDAALAPLRDHESRFPHGALAEERELLFVQALSGAGQLDAARSRERAFEAEFPRSIFLPAARAASSTSDL